MPSAALDRRGEGNGDIQRHIDRAGEPENDLCRRVAYEQHVNAGTGQLSGTPTTTGSSSFTVTATDNNSAAQPGSQSYTLTVNSASSLCKRGSRE